MRAGLPARRRGPRGPGADRAAPDQPGERLGPARASTWSPSRSPSRTTTCTSCRCCAWPGSRCGPRTAGPAIPLVDPGRGGGVPEPGAPGALRRPHRGGRGRGAGAADDGRARWAPPTPRAGSTALTEKDGFYVPSRYEVRYHDDGTVAAYDGPGPVVRQRGWPGKMALPQSVILTPHTEMSMKFMVEISRGCPCMCRFCWAGYNYLPVRGFSRKRDRGPGARGAGGARTRSASSPPRSATTRRSTASWTTWPAWATRSRWPRCASTTSRRSFVFKLADTGVQGLTLAPECGTDRMRRILNKQFTNDEILDKATWIFENGIQNLKLYYMVGLPWEEHADVEGIVDPHRADPRADARRWAAARGRVGPHPPLGEPVRAQAGDALPVAAHGGPEGDRPQAPVPAQGLRPDAERGRHHQERAHRRRRSPILALADRRVADALEIAVVQRRGPQARHEGGGPRPALLPLPRPRPRRGPALGHRGQRREQGLLPARAGQER